MNENCTIDEILIMKKKTGNNISKLCAFFCNDCKLHSQYQLPKKTFHCLDKVNDK